MKSRPLFALIFAAVSLFAAAALASPADSVLSSLLKARESLVTLLDTTDKTTQATLQENIQKATKDVDETLKSALADKATPKEQAATYKEFKAIWEDFKKTRDTEIIPAVKSGKVDTAKSIAKGIQAERLAKMKQLLASLGAK